MSAARGTNVTRIFPGNAADVYAQAFGIHPSEEAYARTRVLADMCAKCDGELDTGWECNKCGWDGRPFALMIDAPKVKQ